MAAGAKAARGSVRRRTPAPCPALASIPTVHSGVLMRSRLEAHWARLLDVLGVQWQYEPQVLRLGSGYRREGYVPDFWLPELRTWLEVKGPHWERFEKTRRLAKDLGRSGHVLVGTASGVCWRVPPAGPPSATEVYQGPCQCGRTALGVPTGRARLIGCRACDGTAKAAGVFGW
jgi:hypothetical protein